MVTICYKFSFLVLLLVLFLHKVSNFELFFAIVYLELNCEYSYINEVGREGKREGSNN